MKKETVKTKMRMMQARKIFLSLSLLFIVAISSVHAGSNPAVNEKVKESFQKEFVGAQLISWTELGEFFKATFIFGDQRTEAYFRENGQLEGSIRSIFYSQLPLVVMTSVDKRFPKADILEVSEINNSSGTTYLVNLEYKQRKYKVKLNSNGGIKDLEKQKK